MPLNVAVQYAFQNTYSYIKPSLTPIVLTYIHIYTHILFQMQFKNLKRAYAQSTDEHRISITKQKNEVLCLQNGINAHNQRVRL